VVAIATTPAASPSSPSLRLIAFVIASTHHDVDHDPDARELDRRPTERVGQLVDPKPSEWSRNPQPAWTTT
jgi:hypothetical protein